MAPRVNIISNGARTPLGLLAEPSAIAVRAGITSISEHPFMIDQVGDPMPGSLDSQIPPGVFGADRMMELAESALHEVCTPLRGLRLPPIPVFLGLPEIRPGFDIADAGRIRSDLAKIEGLPIKLSDITVTTEGHAAGLSSMATAVERIRNNEFEICLVGGVESYFDPDTMEWLDENRQLTGAVSRSGFVPSEGAGFCLLMNDLACNRYNFRPQARVVVATLTNETKLIKSSDMNFGEGLIAAVDQAIEGLKEGELVNQVICDINGERYRGEEWGFVCLKMSHFFDDPTAYFSPADRWGDVGAASGPLFAMLACQAAGTPTGPRTMLWASSENGLRGVVILETLSDDGKDS